MSTVAILGAGPLGGTLAATLAWNEVCPDVLLFDEAGAVAAGKALDILQSCTVRGSDTRLRASADRASLADAAISVVADDATGAAEWQGELGLARLARVLPGKPHGPILFAGASQPWLLERCVIELGYPREAVLGTAPLAFEGALRTIAALEAETAAGDVALSIVGRPPSTIAILWESARIAGGAATERLDAHAIRRIELRLNALWPPGPYALASAAARVIQTMLTGTEGTLTCLVLADRALEAAARPVRLAPSGIAEILPHGAAGRALLALKDS
jgi:malate/lactate dehydrogenase